MTSLKTRLAFEIVFPLLLLAGCTQIWNAGDLIVWVEQQAVRAGCNPDSIELADWYVEKEGANVWQGTCVNEETGETMALEIGVDSVWQPSADTGASQADMAESGDTAEAGRLAPEQLVNSEYSGIYDEPVPLVDGFYEGNAFEESNPPIFTVEYVDGSEYYADLNADGAEDAVVFLLERGGGTGAFTYIAAQINRDGEPVDAGAVRIGDRIQVKSVSIDGGEVALEAVVEGPGDGACCPSHKTSRTYALEDGAFVETTAPDAELVRISADDLDGTSWILAERNYDEPALGEPEVNLVFDGSEFSGAAGCNSYSAGFSLGDDNPFVLSVDPIVTTQMACPDPIQEQETRYLSALKNASQWAYVIEDLAVYYLDDEGAIGRLLFERGPLAE